MRVLLVTAPELNRRSIDGLLPPGGSMYLAGKLRGLGHEVDQVDLDAFLAQHEEMFEELTKHPCTTDFDMVDRIVSGESRDQGLDDLIDRLVEIVGNGDYGLVGISGRRTPGTMLLTRKMRERFSVPIIVGGHLDTDPREFMEKTPQADYFGGSIGEGPLPILIKHLEGQNHSGDLYNLIIRDKDGLRISDWRDVPLTQRVPGDIRGLEVNHYLLQRPHGQLIPNPGARIVAPVQFSMGCPHNCSYCKVKVDDKQQFVIKDPGKVVDELEWWTSLGIRDFAFLNNTISVGSKFIRSLTKGIMDRGLKIRWSDSANFVGMSESDIEIMRESGCVFLTIGLESASPRILKKMHRRYTPEKASRVLKTIHRAGIWTQVNVIVGFPGESHDDYELTARFVEEHARWIDAIGLTPFYLSDSRISRDPERFNIRIREDRSGVRSRHMASSIAFDELDGDMLSYEDHHIEAQRRNVELRKRYNRARGRIRPINDILEVHDVFTYLHDNKEISDAVRNDSLRFLLYVGSECHNSCADCPFSSGDDQVAGRTTADIVRAAKLARDSSYGKVMMVGGEPTIRTDFTEIIRRLSGMRFSELVIETDGSTITAASDAEFLKEHGVTEVLLKFQGGNREIHDRVVDRPGAFARLVVAAELLKRAGVRIGRAKPVWMGACSPCISREAFRALRGPGNDPIT